MFTFPTVTVPALTPAETAEARAARIEAAQLQRLMETDAARARAERVTPWVARFMSIGGPHPVSAAE